MVRGVTFVTDLSGYAGGFSRISKVVVQADTLLGGVVTFTVDDSVTAVCVQDTFIADFTCMKQQRHLQQKLVLITKEGIKYIELFLKNCLCKAFY